MPTAAEFYSQGFSQGYGNDQINRRQAFERQSIMERLLTEIKAREEIARQRAEAEAIMQQNQWAMDQMTAGQNYAGQMFQKGYRPAPAGHPDQSPDFVGPYGQPWMNPPTPTIPPEHRGRVGMIDMGPGQRPYTYTIPQPTQAPETWQPYTHGDDPNYLRSSRGDIKPIKSPTAATEKVPPKVQKAMDILKMSAKKRVDPRDMAMLSIMQPEAMRDPAARQQLLAAVQGETDPKLRGAVEQSIAIINEYFGVEPEYQDSWDKTGRWDPNDPLGMLNQP